MPRPSRPLGFALTALAFLALGCDAPVICGHPLLAVTDTEVVLATTIAAPGQEESSYYLFTAAGSDLARWRREGPFAGKPVGMIATPEGVELVLENGAILRQGDSPEATKSRLHRGAPAKLATAAQIGGQWHAAALAGPGQIILYRLTEGEWSPAAPALAIIGLPRQLRLVSWRDHPLLHWRADIGGHLEADLRLAVWEDDDWRYLPSPPPLRGHAAALDRDGSLFLARDKIAPSPSAVICHVFEEGRWRALAYLPTAVAGIFRRGTGAAIAPLGGDILFIHADTASLRAWQATADPVLRWRSEFEIWNHGPAAAGTIILFLLLVAGGAALLLLSRALRRSLQGKNRRLAAAAIGGLASPLDRSLAFAVDAILLLPLPLAYRWTSSDNTPLLLIPERDHLTFYWLWVGGICLYLAIAEYATGCSVGKRLLGLRVRDLAGRRLAMRQAVLRNLGRILDFWPVTIFGVHMPYLIGLLLISFMPRRQRLGDLFGRTVVRYHTPLNRREIVLASSSPRRRLLLQQMGLAFRVEVPAIDENRERRGNAEEMALTLAQRKAEAVCQRLRGSELIIAADTIVVFGDRIIGKPQDRDEARRILRLLSGQTHRVLTAVAIIDRATEERWARVVASEVQMRDLGDEEIEAYVSSGEADDKAGAYAAQETGDRFIREIRGSVSNVVGLPLEALEEMLEEIAG